MRDRFSPSILIPERYINMKYLTPREAAAILRCDVQTIYNWIHDGQLRAIKIGKRWKITEEAIHDLGTPNTSK